MAIHYKDIEMAFDFVSSGRPGECEAYLNIHTGKTHIHSQYVDIEEALPEDIDDETKYISLPHKNDLDLGKELALNFAYQYLPDEAEKIEDIFKKKGAYSRFKSILEAKDAVEKWYEYEKNEEERVLREWCELNEIKLSD
ncbi:hypothetical protein MNBD_GAMMA10-2697 [hydrothermal vent metagenome]|uniref:Uncharacterized protein n=1 Tax=hydrothermal vent metagenome TaxID=652676 RepID=A0A3B0XW06_9ZZZZ